MTSVSSASSPAPSTSSSSLSAPYLTNPTPKPKLATPPPPPPPTIRKDRLYIGNLHPTVDEYVLSSMFSRCRKLILTSCRYTLLQIFQKHGKVAHLDFLFHKTGPAKGRPRGYAFLEYSDKEVCFPVEHGGTLPFVRHARLLLTTISVVLRLGRAQGTRGAE